VRSSSIGYKASEWGCTICDEAGSNSVSDDDNDVLETWAAMLVDSLVQRNTRVYDEVEAAKG